MGGQFDEEVLDVSATAPAAPVLQHKVAPVAGLKVLDEEQGIVSTIVSVTGIEDDVKDRILPGAYAKTLIDRTPKGVWSHDWDTPISKTVTVEELMPGDPRLPTKQRNGLPWPKEAGALLVQTQFNMETQRGQEAFSDVKFFGDEQEWSIGYNVPVGGAKIDRKTGVREIGEIELFEYSPVLFGAMSLTVTTDVKTAQAAIREMEAKEATKPHDFRGEDDEKCQICDELYDHAMHIGSPKWKAENEDGEKAGDLAVEDKAAIGSHSTETSDATWDGPAQEANLSNDDGSSVYRKAYAWVDGEGDADAKASYRFIHHFVSDGDPGAASTTACSTGIGVLNGGRGGTAIPDGDVQGVYNHLAKHLRDADMEPPELKAAAAEEKPYDVEERNGQYCVVNSDTGDVKGCHDTRDEAEAQRRALYANEPDAAKKDVFTDSPTGEPIPAGFGRVGSGGVVGAPGSGLGSGTIRVVENHSSCPEGSPYGVEQDGQLISCSATREEADSVAGGMKAAREAIEAKRTAEDAEARARLGDRLAVKGVPVGDGDAPPVEDGYSFVETYTSASRIAEELDSSLDALQGAIGRADQETADALWIAADKAADALLEALGVDDTDDAPTTQALTGDGWDPECDPGTMAQAADACVDQGLAAWQAGNFAEAAALVFAADCSIDELLEYWGLGDDASMMALPMSWYDEWAADLPEAAKDPAALSAKLQGLRARGTKEGRVLSGGNADAVVNAVAALLGVLDGANIDHPWKDVAEPGANSESQPEGTVMGVTTVPNDTTSGSLKAAGGEEKEQDAGEDLTFEEVRELQIRALSLSGS